jgi:hypothetical protein
MWLSREAIRAARDEGARDERRGPGEAPSVTERWSLPPPSRGDALERVGTFTARERERDRERVRPREVVELEAETDALLHAVRRRGSDLRGALDFVIEEARIAAQGEASVELVGQTSARREVGYRDAACDAERAPELRIRLRAGLDARWLAMIAVASIVGLPLLFHALGLGAGLGFFVAPWVPLIASTVTRERELVVTREEIVLDAAERRPRRFACADTFELRHVRGNGGGLSLGGETLLRGAMPSPFVARLPAIVRAYRAYVRAEPS